MHKQTQSSLALVGVISAGIFVTAFVVILVLGTGEFNTAFFGATLIALLAATFLFVAFHPRSRQVDTPLAAAKPATAAPAPAPATAPEPASAPAATEAAPPAPEPVAAPTAGVDDLKLLKGVGPALEKKLHENGVTSFAQIAAWSPADVAEMDDRLAFKGRIDRDGWIEQARTLAAGGETEFSKRASYDN